LLGAIAAAVKDRNTEIHYYGNMLTFDNYALAFSVLICATAFLWFLMAEDFFPPLLWRGQPKDVRQRMDPTGRGLALARVGGEVDKTDRYALVLFAIFGAVLMASYSNMVMLFLGIEILSIPLYVLAGSRKDDLFSNESSMKYFLLGAFATGFLLFGIALLYGYSGSFDISTIYTKSQSSIGGFSISQHPSNVLLYGGILFILIGLSFKVAAVPFHFWTPDVYQGAPTPVTAFMASIVKIAAFAAFLRLFLNAFSGTQNAWLGVVWTLSALTILLGNITAVYQTSIKRMLAYSSISHAGYMLLAILAMNQHSAGAILYYTAAYSVSTIAAFAVLSILESANSQSLLVSDEQQTTGAGQLTTITFDSLAGLAKQNKFLAFAMTIAMLSLAGIPPLAGFFGKYYIFTSAIQSGYLYLVLIAVLGSLIAVYYYFRVIIVMYREPLQTGIMEERKSGKYNGMVEEWKNGRMGSSPTFQPSNISLCLIILLVMTIALALVLGIFSEWIIGLL
jgi:NADH-quinone oxidoreductase subunit N